MKNICLSTLSAVLLILAFPQANFWILTWVGLIPLLFVLDGKSARESFGWAYLAGLIFFWGTLYWFVYVTWIGAILLIAYLSLYFGLFGLGYFWIRRSYAADQNVHDKQRVTNNKIQPIISAIFLAALWTCLEFLRGHLFTGFDWASLSHSQASNLWMIQIADVTGVYGISFAIVLFNITAKDVLTDMGKGWSFNIAQLLVGMGCIYLILGYGLWRLEGLKASASNPWKVAVIQANIAQDSKSSQSYWIENFDRHVTLTLEAAEQNPDLIIWPETSLPGYMWETSLFITEIRDVAQKIKTPILLGAVTEHHGQYFNASMLIDADGQIAGEYDKIHLVPFGEYVPFKGLMPQKLADRIPFDDFSAGTKFHVFSVEGHDQKLKLATLICFEDTLARLTSRFVVKGAELLVNITNDAWFGDSKEPFLHLNAAVFRTIENRRWLIRSANTGVSCAVDPSGKVVDAVQNSLHTKTFVEGWRVFNVAARKDQTFYMKFGDLFAYLCFGIAGFGLAVSFRRTTA